MTNQGNVRARLRQLLDDGSLPSSACSRAFVDFIQPLIAGGIVIQERAGAGRRLVVHNKAALEAWYQDKFPGFSKKAAPARISALAQFRNTKALRGDTASTIQVRCWAEDALFSGTEPVPAAEATRTHGLFSFALEPECPLRFHVPCAAIENPAVFHAFEKLGLTSHLPAAIYSGGRMSGPVLSWLAAHTASQFRLIHFPDYDPVGLAEYIRLRTALGDRVTLHVPGTLPEAFRKFSNRDLLRKTSTQAMLAKLRSSTLPEVQSVLRLIDQHNAGLEQEALLLM